MRLNMNNNKDLYCKCESPKIKIISIEGKECKVCVKSKGGCGKEYNSSGGNNMFISLEDFDLSFVEEALKKAQKY
jgi:hypothetical protein